MIKLKGFGGAPGKRMGKAAVLRRSAPPREAAAVEDAAAEVEKLWAGRTRYAEELARLADDARAEGREAEAGILEAYIAIADDGAFFGEVAELIQNARVSAASAVEQKRAEAEEAFAQIEDEYLRQRLDDVNNVCRELVEAMKNDRPSDPFARMSGERFIVFAEDLTPAETMRMDRARLGGLVTSRGGPTSHTVILAKSLGIPAVVGVGPLPDMLQEGAPVLVDGDTGEVTVQPDEETCNAFAQARRREEDTRARWGACAPGRACTRDGRAVRVCVNTDDAQSAAAIDFNCCEGVGLYRTEFLYMGRADYPSEETQYVVYRDVVRRAGGKEVVIRTLDAGADKQVGYMGLADEMNPSLGLRGIRLCLARPEMFGAQLRAILRAGAEGGGDVRLLLPMVVSLEEVLAAKAELQKAKEELLAQGMPCAERMPVGVMVETPAAVLIAEDLARECDFFSIGTNDLTQYVMASDRQNAQVQYLHESCSPPVVRAVRHTCRAARGAGIPVSICGEAASDERLVPLWVAMGVDELSVAPGLVGRTKYTVGRVDMAAAKDTLDALLQTARADEMQRQLERLWATLGVE